MNKAELISILKENREILKVESSRVFSPIVLEVDYVKYNTLKEFGEAVMNLRDDSLYIMAYKEREGIELKKGDIITSSIVRIVVGKEYKAPVLNAEQVKELEILSDKNMQAYYANHGTSGEY